MGKFIYESKGKASEYAKYAANGYVGCSNGCSYCYLKKGRGAKILGGDTPKLKKCFKSEEHALYIFKKELLKNLDEIKKHGIFFSFTTDPMIYETIGLTVNAVSICQQYDVPVKILTKSKNFIYDIRHEIGFMPKKELIAIGFTLTGHDELEPKATKNQSRLIALKQCKELGFKTFASIEPIIDFQSSKRMIEESIDFCDLYKVGLESGKKYNKKETIEFVKSLSELKGPKIYIKESLQKATGDEELNKKFVKRDYNIF